MQRVLFICHGNICRSTMAESVFTELVRRAGLASYTELLQTAGLKVPFAEGSVKGIAQQMTRWLEEHQVG